MEHIYTMFQNQLTKRNGRKRKDLSPPQGASWTTPPVGYREKFHGKIVVLLTGFTCFTCITDFHTARSG